MRIGNNGRRGMTLAELSIVLAVIAIVSTLVVTFVVLVNERSNASTARLDALNEVALAESMIESHLESGESVSDDDFNLETKVLTLGSVTHTFTKIINIEITKKHAVENDANSDTLFICTVTYNIFDNGAAEPETYTFVVDPHVGEAVSNG